LPDFLSNKMTTIITFSISLSVSALLIIIKAFELKHEKRNFVLEILGKLDSRVVESIGALKFRIYQLIQTLRYLVLVEFASFLKRHIDSIKERIMNEIKIRQEIIIMGRKNISNNSSASFYLKKIAENKSAGEKGKIE